MIRVLHGPILRMGKLTLGLIIHLLEGRRLQEVGLGFEPGPSQASGGGVRGGLELSFSTTCCLFPSGLISTDLSDLELAVRKVALRACAAGGAFLAKSNNTGRGR